MWVCRHKRLVEVMVLFAFFCFTAPGFAASPFAGRILPTGKIDLFRDGNHVGQYTAEAPLPLDTLIACQGRAAVRMNQLFVVLEDGSSFMVSQKDGATTLDLRKGTAYFVLSVLPEGLAFATPQGTVATQGMMLNAATGSRVLKGYVKVGETSSELGVLEGGSLQVQAPDGERTIHTGERIILAQSKLDEDEGAAAGAGGGIAAEIAVAAGLASAAIIAAAASLGEGGEGSPFTPPSE